MCYVTGNVLQTKVHVQCEKHGDDKNKLTKLQQSTCTATNKKNWLSTEFWIWFQRDVPILETPNFPFNKLYDKQLDLFMCFDTTPDCDNRHTDRYTATAYMCTALA